MKAMKLRHVFSVPAMMILAGAMCLTSCEDILGQWDKPTPATPAAGAVDETIAAAPGEYLEWSTADSKLVIKDIPAGYTSMTNATTSWNGNYIVDSDVTIDNDVTISGDVNIILKDGFTLKVNKRVSGAYKLCIFAQNSDAASAGKLVIEPDAAATSSSSALSVAELQIHGGNITATGHDNASSYDGDDGIKTSGKLFVYSGKVTATAGAHSGGSNMGGIGINCGGNELHVYKAEVNATGGNTTSSGSTGNGIACGGTAGDPCLTIDGGTVTAKAGDATGATAGIRCTWLTVNSGKLFAQGNTAAAGKGFDGSVLYFSAGLTAKGGSDGVNYPNSYSNGQDPEDKYLKVE